MFIKNFRKFQGNYEIQHFFIQYAFSEVNYQNIVYIYLISILIIMKPFILI